VFSAVELLDSHAPWSASGFHLVSILTSVVIAGLVVAVVWLLLKSEFGVVLRATGENEALVEGLGRRPHRYHTIGLMLANGLVGFAGCLVAARQGFADVNMGFGVIITLVAALVIGEEAVRLLGLNPALHLSARVLAGILGGCVYFFLYLIILRASILGWIPIRIQPTDLKLMSALIVILFVVVRSQSRTGLQERGEVLPI